MAIRLGIPFPTLVSRYVLKAVEGYSHFLWNGYILSVSLFPVVDEPLRRATSCVTVDVTRGSFFREIEWTCTEVGEELNVGS